MFKKKFDYNDISNFQMDNKEKAAIDFFNKRFSNKFPEYVVELINNDEKDEQQKEINKQEILKRKKEYEEKLLKEFEERQNITYEEQKLENTLEYYDEYLTPKINNLVINNE